MTCSLCGWPIETWQPFIRKLSGEDGALEWSARHTNVMDCKPTKEPE